MGARAADRVIGIVGLEVNIAGTIFVYYRS